jgi:alpha-tubulin suppressor-like RCC1 family protein
LVDAGAAYTCGLTPDRAVICWGAEGGSCFSSTDGTSGCERTMPFAEWQPEGAFQAVSVGDPHAGGLRVDASLECWSWNFDESVTTPKGEFQSVSVGNTVACGARTNSDLYCWQMRHGKAQEFPEGQFQAVSVYGRHFCAIRSDEDVHCWGADYYDQLDAPTDRFASISVGSSHTCGVRLGGDVACWGMVQIGQRLEDPVPRRGKFVVG